MTALSVSDVLWSDWVRWNEALDVAPRKPGVYVVRQRVNHDVVYIGMAGERRGSRDRPQGLRGRLAVYTSGKALASGLGEAVLDRALADPGWLRRQLAELEVNGPSRAKRWGVAAFARADLEVRWTVTDDSQSARDLERSLISDAADVLWNRRAKEIAGRAMVTGIIDR